MPCYPILSSTKGGRSTVGGISRFTTSGATGLQSPALTHGTYGSEIGCGVSASRMSAKPASRVIPNAATMCSSGVLAISSRSRATNAYAKTGRPI